VREKEEPYWRHISSHHAAVPVISLYSDELRTGPAVDPPSSATTQRSVAHDDSLKYQQFRIFRVLTLSLMMTYSVGWLGFNGAFNTIQVISHLKGKDYIVNITDLIETHSANHWYLQLDKASVSRKHTGKVFLPNLLLHSCSLSPNPPICT